MARSHQTVWMTLAVALCAGAVCLAVDESSVQVDPAVDFSTFRSFALRTGRVESPRPELDNPLFIKRLGKAITAALTGKGLAPVSSGADLVVDYTVTGEDFGRAARPPMRGLGPHPVRFTEGTLVIDVFSATVATPIWRGTYTDSEKTGSKLVVRLPDDARKLLSKYPQLRK